MHSLEKILVVKMNNWIENKKKIFTTFIAPMMYNLNNIIQKFN